MLYSLDRYEHASLPASSNALLVAASDNTFSREVGVDATCAFTSVVEVAVSATTFSCPRSFDDIAHRRRVTISPIMTFST